MWVYIGTGKKDKNPKLVVRGDVKSSYKQLSTWLQFLGYDVMGLIANVETIREKKKDRTRHARR
jgi:hypothetical protein